MTTITTAGLTRVAAIGAIMLLLGAGGSAQTQKPIEIRAERFAFTPSRVSVTLGDEVQFRLVSDDTGHGFRILDTDINVAIPKRGQGDVIVRFTPQQAGRIVFECSRMCGAGHNFMRGEIDVKPRSAR
ncbi:MAG: cupredoxin domain-containing protein [Acidobacteriota bacterium]|nr:cupredoxin domain-containing protein [Acidobacteriota bacterium]